MTSKKVMVYLVAFLALAVFSFANVSAFGTIVDLEVKGTDVLGVANAISVSAGEVVPVRVEFLPSVGTRDVRVEAEISGVNGLEDYESSYDIVHAGELEVYTFNMVIPRDLDEIRETLFLEVSVEARQDGTADKADILLSLQREPYVVGILDAEMPNEVNAGEILPVDVVLTNLGAEFAEDTFVRVRVDALGIEDRAFFGDLSPIDEPFSRDPFFADDVVGRDRLDKEDSAERRLFLRIPSGVTPGLYDVEVEAFNDDTATRIVRKVAISGAEDTTMVVSPVHSRAFSVGESREYSLTIVNTGSRIGVFELVVESPAGLNIEASEAVVAVPAGSSMTVRLQAEATEAGKYNFAVNVHSDGQLVKRESFSANVDGSKANVASPTVLLTVVLAIIFIVLLIVLIVLLTRRPERTEDGEGYY